MSTSSPSVNNLTILKGTVSFTLAGATLPRDLGNAPVIRLSPQVEILEHYSSRAGVRSRDKTVVTQVGGEVALTLDEITPDNLALAFLGDVTGAPTAPVIGLLTNLDIEGLLTVTGTNDVGNRYKLSGVKVKWRAAQQFDLVSEEFAQLELVGDWLRHDTDATYPYGKLEELV